MTRIWGREPAMWAALAAALVQGAGLALHWNSDQMGAINAVVAVVLGLVVAISVRDGISAVALGLVQAVMNLVLAFGLNVDTATQAAVMGLAAAIVGMFVRTQVTAKTPSVLDAHG